MPYSSFQIVKSCTCIFYANRWPYFPSFIQDQDLGPLSLELVSFQKQSNGSVISFTITVLALQEDHTGLFLSQFMKTHNAQEISVNILASLSQC